LISFLGHK